MSSGRTSYIKGCGQVVEVKAGKEYWVVLPTAEDDDHGRAEPRLPWRGVLEINEYGVATVSPECDGRLIRHLGAYVKTEDLYETQEQAQVAYRFALQLYWLQRATTSLTELEKIVRRSNR